MGLKFHNRYTQSIEEEKVYGGAFLIWLYQTSLGQNFAILLSKKIFSKIYGFFQNRTFSKKKIIPFIESFKISDEFLPEKGFSADDPYPNFNSFFIRRFQEGRRPFVQDDLMPAFSEARYLGFSQYDEGFKIPIKGVYFSCEQILEHSHWFQTFRGGPLLIARLCPVDYHRFHFPDNGKILARYSLKGPLHSVNPLAFHFRPDILCSNERQVSILETKHFGKLAYIEVGAICVGKIIQTHKEDSFTRGQEKGYFLFGASTVIVIGEPNAWIPAQDISEHSQSGLETYIRLGDTVAIVQK